MREHSDIVIGLGVGLVAVAAIAWVGKKAVDGAKAAAAAIDPTDPLSMINNNSVTGGVDYGYQDPTPYGVLWGIGQSLAGAFSSDDQPETSGTSVKPIASGNSGWSLTSWINSITHPADAPVATTPATSTGGATGSW
jgi:hypothetical protein